MNSDDFRGLIKKYMEIRHIKTLEELSKHTTICYKTFLKYWKAPELFPIGAAVQIMDALRIPYEERSIILRKGK
jgi:hypothetical protein